MANYSGHQNGRRVLKLGEASNFILFKFFGGEVESREMRHALRRRV